jgi:hypothetical protein
VALPTSPGLRSVEFNMNDAVATVTSPFTGQTQTQVWPGADSISGTITLPPMNQAQAGNWIACLGELRGMANGFLLGDPMCSSPTGSGAGVPIVDMGVANANYLYQSQGIGLLSPWTTDSQWASITTTSAPDGGLSASACVTSADPTDAYIVQQVNNNGMMVGWTMTFSVYLRSPAGPTTVNIYLNDAVGDTATVCAVTTAWQRFYVTRTIQSIASVLVQIGGGGSVSTPNFTLDVAWAVLQEGSVPIPNDGTFGYYGEHTGTTLSVTSSNTTGSTTLATRGWLPNQFRLLMPGDCLQVGYRLHRVLDVVNSDENGMAQISIWPSLREVPTDGEAIILNNPKGLFRLATNKRTWSSDYTRLTNLSFQILEFR